MTLPRHDHSSSAATADVDLILRTRSGDRGAFSELWRRHYLSGKSVARSITSSIDPDDLVQESYTRIYQAILKGGGPNGSFRAYLFTSIRNTAAAWGRSRRETPIYELESVVDPDTTEAAADEALDRDLTAQAFRSLPSRWQEVLWYTEIEQMKPAEVAPLLGMKAGAVSQLAFRAREGLREAWIQAHLRNAGSGSECRWTIEHLGAHSRGNLSTRDQKRLDQHIDECVRCAVIAVEAKDISDRLALVLLPLVLGVSGAAGYLATLQSATPVVAVAAMPSSVFEGAVIVPVGGASTGAFGLPVEGSGGAGSAGGGIAGGPITGIGALVGAGSAALVIAGVVAAATIVPGLVNADAATSLPSASDVGNSSISSEVESDQGADTDDTFLLEIAEAPKPPNDEDQTPEVERQVDDATPEPDRAPPVTTAPPAQGADGSEPTPSPATPEKPTTPGEGDETDPTPSPEPTPEPTVPADPTAPVTIAGSSTWIDSSLKTHVSVSVVGVPGVPVHALINGSSDGADQIVLDAQGKGVIDLRPTAVQILFNASVTIQYVTDDGVQYPLNTRLARLGLTPPPEESPDVDHDLTDPAPQGEDSATALAE